MHLSKLISHSAAFNEWANQKMTSWLMTLDEEKIYRKTFSSFVTIDYTPQYILRTQRFWLAFIDNRDIESLDWSIRENEFEKILIEINKVSMDMKLLSLYMMNPS
jgi:uncharacterized damage-inducible protein DinB